MAEYLNVEKPFLDKLQELNWQVIDQGQGIPHDPSKSLRSGFREVVLEKTFKNTVRRINLTEQGEEWLTDKQLDDILAELTHSGTLKLHEANKRAHELLIKKTSVSENELTGEKDPPIKLIDFDNWENNSFIAINQFRIDTPNTSKKMIIPDIVLFVNGLPLVVVEAKDMDVSEPLSDAERQIRRYSNRRDDEFGVREGEERLFHFNLFSIITHGTEARVGSVTAGFDYYYNWKDIFPEDYQTFSINAENEQTQNVMIGGMLNKEILLDILKNFTIFMQLDSGHEIKIVPRYQQYRAVGKIIKRLRTGKDHKERSGVVWHTQGSGKSLTMAFTIRKIRSQPDLKDNKIILVVDRTDLEEQLTNTARLAGKVNVISKRRDLDKLASDASNINMVMIHKFLQEQISQSKALQKAFKEKGKVPEFEPFKTVNTSDRILIMIDEAHRTQGGDMGDNLFLAFPNATKMAFTGTPLLTHRHKRKTHERFGGHEEFIDEYKIKEAVQDRATLPIVYLGRTSDDKNRDPDAFQAEFEDLFKAQTDEEKLEIQKRYGTMQAYLENKDRLKKIADDLVDHYVQEILPNGFKAMVVSNSILSACRYKFFIERAIQRHITAEKAKEEEDQDKDLLKRLEFLKVAGVVSSQDNNESAFITQVRNEAKEKNAVESFKKGFDYNKPETGIAFICVCDRLLTGFDAPIAQVMYLDKNLREHDLLQSIARVNRTKGASKKYGLVVDYYGVSNHLKEALAIYDGDEDVLDELMQGLKDINKEFPVLEARYQRLIQLFEDYGVKDIEAFVNQKMSDSEKENALVEKVILLAGDVKFRAQFDTYLKAFFDVLDLLLNLPKAQKFWIPCKRFGYLLMRIKNHYRDPTMDLKWAGEKVRKLIDKYLYSEGINSKIAPISLLSDEFPKHIDKRKLSPKAKASEMEHAIRRHVKINTENDPALYTKFKERLELILARFKDNWEQCVLELDSLRSDISAAEGEGISSDGLPSHISPFYGLIQLYAYDNQDLPADKVDTIKTLIGNIVEALQKRIDIINFWKKNHEIQQLESEIDDLLDFCGISEIEDKHKKITTEILALAKKRHRDLIANKD
jgi:type I restriction enzyme R subunit